MRDVCITGLPGSGKGTLAKNLELLADSMALKTTTIVTGDIAREISAESRSTGAFAPEPELRRRVQDIVDEARDANSIVIMEGFPRTVAQMAIAELMLERPLYVIMDTPLIMCMRRLLGRGRNDDMPDNIGKRLVDHQQIVGEVMSVIKSGEVWEDYMVVSNNDLVHCKQVAISAEW